MTYDAQKRKDLLQKAQEFIEQNKIEEFKQLLTLSYTVEEHYLGMVTVYQSYPFTTNDDYWDGSYEVEGTLIRDAECSYLLNLPCLGICLNNALIQRQHAVIKYLLEDETSEVNTIYLKNKTFKNSFRKRPLFSYKAFLTYADDENLNSLNLDFKKIFDQIGVLENKTAELELRNELSAASCAYALALNLQKEFLAFVVNEDKALALENLKKDCQKHISHAQNSKLSEHRGMKKLLLNLGLAILGLGIFYLAAATVNYFETGKKHFFFHPETKAEEIVRETQEILEQKLQVVIKF